MGGRKPKVRKLESYRLGNYEIRIETKRTPYTGRVTGVVIHKIGPHESLGKKLDEVSVIITLQLNSNNPIETFYDALGDLVESGKMELQYPYALAKYGDSYRIVDKEKRKFT